MKKPHYYPILSLLLFPLAAFLQTKDNVELKKMFDEDQNSRKALNIDWKEISKNDSIREKRVYELINSGLIVTGQDYFNSALIFQHGRDSVAYGMAVKQMKKAIQLDTSINKWLLAAAIDRELTSKNKPQIYGTQYYMDNQNGKLVRYKIDTTQVTDEERRYYHVETLKEQSTKLKNMNLRSISEFYSNSNSMNQTIKLIEAENKKGDNSEFNVSEEGINSFGYQLLKSKKIDEAFLVFTLNTKIYPDGFNAFDSLGECLFQLDKKSDGIKAYKQSLALNPKNENARKIINENE